MGSVDVRHAGAASGINNAVARTAGLLAVAALGVVLLVRFDSEVEHRLAGLGLSDHVRNLIESHRSKLTAAELPGDLDSATRDAIRDALNAAFVTGFRTLMLACAGLAALSAFASLLLVEGKARSRTSLH
jgi:hypothetical protein